MRYKLSTDIKDVGTFFKLGYSMGKNVKFSIFPCRKKDAHKLRPNKKVCNTMYVAIAHYFYSEWAYFKLTVVLEHV